MISVTLSSLSHRVLGTIPSPQIETGLSICNPDVNVLSRHNTIYLMGDTSAFQLINSYTLLQCPSKINLTLVC